ncbi:hypothetical protein NAEX_09573 [Nannocystis exedens]|nr:hypothetical protein NAEX_09573 [Nannocystis exedens]
MLMKLGRPKFLMTYYEQQTVPSHREVATVVEARRTA